MVVKLGNQPLPSEKDKSRTPSIMGTDRNHRSHSRSKHHGGESSLDVPRISLNPLKSKSKHKKKDKKKKHSKSKAGHDSIIEPSMLGDSSIAVSKKEKKKKHSKSKRKHSKHIKDAINAKISVDD